jgi:ABC-2 type transport system permease protein
VTRELRAEWTKLRTAPDTAWLPVAAVALTIGLGAGVSAAASPDSVACAAGCDAARLSLSGVVLGQLAVVVFAVRAITGEHHHGLLAVTLAATPQRLVVFAAKTVVLAAVALVTGACAVAGSLVAGRILLPANGFPFHGPFPRASLGAVLYLGLIALLTFGLASVIRHTTPALTVMLALLYLPPLLVRLIPDDRWPTRIERLAPMTAAPAVLAAETAAALLVAATLFARRDSA